VRWNATTSNHETVWNNAPDNRRLSFCDVPKKNLDIVSLSISETNPNLPPLILRDECDWYN
jgi:hypothetical protein